MGYDPADGSYGNPSHFVKGSHATVPAFEMAKDNLIHDAQLIERSIAAILHCQHTEKIPRKFDHGLSRYVVWFISHVILPGNIQNQIILTSGPLPGPNDYITDSSC
jgi:hypothetical protein